MKHLVNPALIVLSLFVASTALAAEYPDLYIIPAVGHTHGAFGTQWRSDVVLHNIQTVPINVEMALVETGRSPSTTPIAISVGAETSLLLAPGETRVITDVVGQQGRDIAGALIIGADLPFVITSRTYADSTLGQSVVPIAMSGSADAASGVSVLAALSADDRHRANIGLFLVASRAPLVAEIALRSSTGASLGSRLVVVDQPGFVHQQLSTADVAGIRNGVTAVIRVVEGDGIVVPYGSLIDNASAESMFVAGQPIGARGAAARVMLSSTVGAGPADH